MKLSEEKSTFEDWFGYITNGKEVTDKPKPVDLPTNLFDEELTRILKSKIESGGLTPWNKPGYSGLLAQWMNNETQPFYHDERQYVVYEQPVTFKLAESGHFKTYFCDAMKKAFAAQSAKRREEKKKDSTLPDIRENDILTVFNNAVTENEKVIRFFQTKDRILLMMVKELMTADKKPDIRLYDIWPGSPKSPLEISEPVEQKVSGILSFDQDGNFLKNIDDRKETVERTITDTRKRKDFSIFKKIISDKRLPELFEYFDSEMIDYQILKKELDNYNKIRERVFDGIFKLEAKLIEKDEVGIRILYTGDTNIPHEPYLLWLKQKGLITEPDFSFLKGVRNSFSHNNFPRKAAMEKLVRWSAEENYSSQIYEHYSKKIEELLTKIGEQP